MLFTLCFSKKVVIDDVVGSCTVALADVTSHQETAMPYVAD